MKGGNSVQEITDFGASINPKYGLILIGIVLTCFNLVAFGEEKQYLQKQQLGRCCQVEHSELENWEDIRNRSNQFVIILGAQKCGTTAMFRLLEQHPKTKRAITKFGRKWYDADHLKELEFFNQPHYKTFKQYLKSFNISALRDGYTFIEATPDYLLSPGAACRIKQYLPNAKFIVMVKNPADRALSNFKMVENYRLCNCTDYWKCKPCGAPLPDFQTPVQERINHFKTQNCDLFNNSWESCYGCYSFRMGDFLPRGFYASQIKEWLEYFPPEQILVLSSKVIYDVVETSKRVFEFANLEPFEMEDVAGFFGVKHNISENVKQGLELLEEFYDPYNQMFYELMENEFHTNFSYT